MSDGRPLSQGVCPSLLGRAINPLKIEERIYYLPHSFGRSYSRKPWNPFCSLGNRFKKKTSHVSAETRKSCITRAQGSHLYQGRLKMKNFTKKYKSRSTKGSEIMKFVLKKNYTSFFYKVSRKKDRKLLTLYVAHHLLKVKIETNGISNLGVILSHFADFEAKHA
jgi:hypothetical protein